MDDCRIFVVELRKRNSNLARATLHPFDGLALCTLTRGIAWRRPMATSSHLGSARIYQFPVKVRTAASLLHAPDLSLASQMQPTAFGSGWYHDEAIREADRERETQTREAWTGLHLV
jgi:hypothetical protein